MFFNPFVTVTLLLLQCTLQCQKVIYKKDKGARNSADIYNVGKRDFTDESHREVAADE